MYSKRDVASGGYQASSSKQQSPSKKSNASKVPESKREASEAKEVKTNKIAQKLKTALEPDMGTVLKQKKEGSKTLQQTEEEEMQNLPVKIERNEEEISNQPAQNDHPSTSEDETEEPETPVRETLPIQGSIMLEKQTLQLSKAQQW